MDCCFPFSNDIIATSAKIEVTNAGQLRNNAVAVPTDRSSAGVEENGKSHTHVAEDIEYAWSTSSSHSMLNRNFSNFFLKYREADRPPPEGDQNLLHSAGRSFCAIDVVRFLEESNAHILWKASQALADTNASYKSEIATLKQDHEQGVLELSSSLKSVSKAFSDASTEVTRLKLSLAAVESELLDSRKAFETKSTLIDELRSTQVAQDDRVRSLTNDVDQAIRSSEEFRAASGDEARRLKSIIEEKEKAFEAETIHTSQVEAKCTKLKEKLAMIEQKAAQESRTSGSYSDDHANPGMLEGACKDVDKATENLARLLHNNSVTKVLPLESPELKQFVRLISPANPADFSRAIQVKYAWSYWVCRQMFEGFEHVFFDADGGLLTSPLDSKSHALECFRRFQQNHNGFSSDLFEAFCSRKFKSVFPSWLVNQAISRTGITCDDNGRFQGDGALHAQFMVVARAVWSLHQLAFSFDPPASILRMAREMPYDHQYHESVVHVQGGPGMSSQMVSLMVRPAFRVRKSVIRGRVFLCDNPNRPK